MIGNSVRSLLAVVVALAFLAGAPAQAAEDDGWTRTSETFPFEGYVTINDCRVPPEAVDFSGTISHDTRTKTDASGFTHVRELLSIIGTGFGETTGASYTLDDVTLTKLKFADPLPIAFKVTRTIVLTGNGVPDMTVDFDSYLRIDAQGNVSHDTFSVKIRCQ